ncbi:MAG: class I SAM-dependent methyltransferase [Candidatus Latescibacterota bacterium]|nr:MAG: class I SAM-dependent methyltransferase [Candidatus Latescibacterota bacterium]
MDEDREGLLMESITSIEHGAITDAEWRALAISITTTARAVPGWFVELGVLKARTTAAILEVLSLINCRPSVLSVDNDSRARKAWEIKTEHRRASIAPPWSLFFSLGFSYDPPFFPNNDKVAWVFADACHCEECVQKDIAQWAPRISLGGVFAFHDASWEQINAGQKVHERYHNDGKVRPYGVAKAIDEAPELEGFRLEAEIPATKRTPPNPPFFGGLKIFRRHE